MPARSTGLIAMANVAEVKRSVDFYALLGLSIRGLHNNPDGTVIWAHVCSARADLMFTRASRPIDPKHHRVVFYLYSPDLVALRNQLLAHGVKVSEIPHPFYMEKGEMCLTDPDGYTLLIDQIE
jgi:hypothetical protein